MLHSLSAGTPIAGTPPRSVVRSRCGRASLRRAVARQIGLVAGGFLHRAGIVTGPVHDADGRRRNGHGGQEHDEQSSRNPGRLAKPFPRTRRCMTLVHRVMMLIGQDFHSGIVELRMGNNRRNTLPATELRKVAARPAMADLNSEGRQLCATSRIRTHAIRRYQAVVL
jgi:hypothetical protein